MKHRATWAISIAAVATMMLLMLFADGEKPNAEFETSFSCDKFTIEKINTLEDGATLWLKTGYNNGQATAQLLTLTIGKREVNVFGPTIFMGSTPAILAEVGNDEHRSLVIGYHRNGGMNSVIFCAIDPNDKALAVDALEVHFRNTKWEEIKIVNGTVFYGGVKIVTMNKGSKMWRYEIHPSAFQKFQSVSQRDGHLSFSESK